MKQLKLTGLDFAAAGGEYRAPVVTLGDFLEEKAVTAPSRILPSYGEGRVTVASPDLYLPRVYTDAIRRALGRFGRTLKGFDTPDALLTGAETRTSSPVRILRTDGRCALGYENIYPVGEGAGYAGGITSAAVDGVRTALALMQKYQPCGDL